MSKNPDDSVVISINAIFGLMFLLNNKNLWGIKKVVSVLIDSRSVV